MQELQVLQCTENPNRIRWSEQLRSEALRKWYAAKIALDGVGEAVSDIYARFPESRRPASEKQIDYADIRNAIRKINYADSRFNEKYRRVVDDAVKDALWRNLIRFQAVYCNSVNGLLEDIRRLGESPLKPHYKQASALLATIKAQGALLEMDKLLDEAHEHLSQC